MSTVDRDRSLIDELHRLDVEASLRGDVDTLQSLMDPDCLVLPPEQDPVPGVEFLDGMRAAIKTDATQILELAQDWQELFIVRDLAWERGIVRYAIRKADGTIIRQNQQLIRLLRRQADGNWRVLRAMWHAPRSAH